MVRTKKASKKEHEKWRFHYLGLNITVGHWPFSEDEQEMTGNTWHLPVKLVSRKRTSTSTSSSFDSSQFEKKDGKSNIRNSPHESLTWLQCDKDPSDRSLVSVLWCNPCQTRTKEILKCVDPRDIEPADNQCH